MAEGPADLYVKNARFLLTMDPQRRLLENAERYCIVLNTLRNGVEVNTDFEVESV